MSTKNRNTGGIGLAAAALAALFVTACDPYMAANTAAPTIIGVAAVDVNQNWAAPPDTAGCTKPYPEPDPTWANQAFPGLCDPTNVARGIYTVCPVLCYPPRTGPAFAPFYMGDTSGSYQTAGSVAVPYTLPSAWVLRHVPTGVYADAWEFAQIRITFNKLMDGSTIQEANVGNYGCTPVATADGPKVYKISPASSAGIGTDVTVTELWSACYYPNSAVSYWGGSMTLVPDAYTLDPDTKYTVRANLKDAQGNPVAVDVTVITDPLVVTPVAPPAQ